MDDLRNLVFTERYASEARHAIGAVTGTALHPFSLAKLYESLAAPHLHIASMEKFPSSLRVMGSLMMILHPSLTTACVLRSGLALLIQRLEEVRFGALAA